MRVWVKHAVMGSSSSLNSGSCGEAWRDQPERSGKDRGQWETDISEHRPGWWCEVWLEQHSAKSLPQSSHAFSPPCHPFRASSAPSHHAITSGVMLPASVCS